MKKRELIKYLSCFLLLLMLALPAVAEISDPPEVKASSHLRGNPNAVITIHEWLDYQCPFCGRLESALAEILTNYEGTVNLVVHHMPLSSIHPNAMKAAIATECLASQDERYFWLMHDWLFENQVISGQWETKILDLYNNSVFANLGIDFDKFTDCYTNEETKSTVTADYDEAIAFGGRGTPNSIIVNNNTKTNISIPGALPYEQFSQQIKALLNGEFPAGDEPKPATVVTKPVVLPEHNIVTKLKDEIIDLKQKIAELEKQVVAREKALVTKVNKPLQERLRGKILLQVEEAGEAWYVDPNSGNRFYLSGGETAYEALRNFGLGITNDNLAGIPVGMDERIEETDSDQDGLPDGLEKALGTNEYIKDTDSDGVDDNSEVQNNRNPFGPGNIQVNKQLTDRLEGKILLQVERHGEAWYIHNGKRYYMQNGDKAYQIMRFLSLGINNQDLRQLPVGELE